MDSKTSFLTGLIGAGIGASLSPPLHEREAELHGLRLLYRLLDLNAMNLDVAKTPGLLTTARQMGFAGVNITHPCKQVVLGHLDGLSPAAAAIGAVNTVVFRDGKATGHNTDWLGFAHNMRRGLPGVPMRHVVLLGAGGAGAAAAHAVLTLGADAVTVVDVDRRRADTLAERLRGQFAGKRIMAGDVASLEPCLATADGLIHATPTGMTANPGLPLPPDALRPHLWVADLVYTPLDTELLRHARAVGCRTLDGGGMLVFQAAEAFRLFTGVEPDAERMLRHFDTLVGRAPARL